MLKCEHTHHFYDIHSIDNDTYNQVIELENWIFSQLEFKPNENSYLIGGELVTQIISDINSFINSSNSLTLLKEYSAHGPSFPPFIFIFLNIFNYLLFIIIIIIIII